MNIEEFVDKMTSQAVKIHINLDKKMSEQLYMYMQLLLEWNEKMNLTAIVEEDEIILKHFIDSLTVSDYIQKGNTVIDIGTGAGFPGIPLAIVNNENKFTLVDSLNKRVNFLSKVKQELKINNIKAIHARIEEIAKNEQYREKYDIITSRAVAKLNILIEYMLPLIKIGGIGICMKGSNIDEELQQSKKALELLGGRIKKIDNIMLPNSDISRNIIIVEKVKSTPEKYPRKAGTPVKEPII